MMNNNLKTGWKKMLSWLTLMAYAGLLCLSVIHIHPSSHHTEDTACHDEASFSSPHHGFHDDLNAACSLCQIINSASHYISSSNHIQFIHQENEFVSNQQLEEHSISFSFISVRAPPLFA